MLIIRVCKTQSHLNKDFFLFHIHTSDSMLSGIKDYLKVNCALSKSIGRITKVPDITKVIPLICLPREFHFLLGLPRQLFLAGFVCCPKNFIQCWVCLLPREFYSLLGLFVAPKSLFLAGFIILKISFLAGF